MSKHRTNDIPRYARMLKALGNPHRLRLFLRLTACCAPRVDCGETEEDARRCVGDLGAELDLAPSTVSHHLKELRQAGLIRMERRGQRIECGASGEALAALRTFLDEVTRKGSQS
jgi:ArsR family transcriptional regulator